MNENYAQPSLPDAARDGIVKGLYKLGSRGDDKTAARVRLVGSGTILLQVIAAADLLAEQFGVASDIFSATSFPELAREARDIERRNRFSAAAEPELSHVETLLAGDLPIVAATDYVRALPQMIAPYLKARLVALGTDGFGRSDTRGALRAFFEVDAASIALAAIEAMVRGGHFKSELLERAIRVLGVDAGKPAPWTV
jgi:pyruvate dehydrogenase E1 component